MLLAFAECPVCREQSIVSALVDFINSYNLPNVHYPSHTPICTLHPGTGPALTLGTWVILCRSSSPTLLSFPCLSSEEAEAPAHNECVREWGQAEELVGVKHGKWTVPLSHLTHSSSPSDRRCCYFRLYEESTYLVCRWNSKLLPKWAFVTPLLL